MMKRPECLKILARHRTNEIVVSAMKACREWPYFSPSDLNCPFLGAMGAASSVGLGLALAMPERKVIILDADGSLLMNLMSLVTIATAVPSNLIHFVFDNEIYEFSGGQPRPGGKALSFAAIAKGAGIEKAYAFDDISDFETEVPRILQEEGPVFVALKVVAGEPVPREPIRDIEVRWRFERALKGQSAH